MPDGAGRENKNRFTTVSSDEANHVAPTGLQPSIRFTKAA
jgi:hypothetical protein